MVVELIAKDKEEKLQFEGRCKLIIDSLSKFLLVEPYNEEFKMISALFKWEFVAQKNILFVFAEYVFQDFALVFDDSNKCNKAYGFLLKKGASAGNKKLIKERFLPPLFEEISKNNPSTSKFNEIFLKWIQLHNGKEKEEYIQLLKYNNVYDLVYPKENGGINARKRKLKDISKRSKNNKMNADVVEHNKANNSTDSLAKRSLPALQVTEITILDNIVEAPNFETLKFFKNGVETTELFVYPFVDKSKYYNYFWDKKMGIFTCFACLKKKQLKAAKIIEKDGNDAVQLLGDHICEISENKKVIEKPNFEEFALDCYKNNSQRLVIFFDSARSYCYEFGWHKSHHVYHCYECMAKKHYIPAEICQKEDGTEFVMLKSSNHICEPRKFNPVKYGSKQIIESVDFQIIEDHLNGINKLIIFTSSDKMSCYEYSWNDNEKKFLCIVCLKKTHHVSADVCTNSDGNKYVKLSTTKHFCNPREYDADKFDQSKKEIIESPNFRIFKYKHNGIHTSKLIVFCETNKNLCYEYSWNEIAHLYFCSHCPIKNYVSAQVCQKEDYKDYLMLSKTQHVCDLKEFDPDKYKDDITVDKSMYKIRMTQNGMNILLIYTSDEKQNYYKFIYNNNNGKNYYCSRCRSLKIYITATIQNEGTENEILYVCNQKHICEPFKYSSLVENSIVKFPNFEIINRKFHGKIVQRLVLFTNGDKTECYVYGWHGQSKTFRCNACKNHHKIYVYAKLFKNDENEECVELCKTKHKCQPIKFIPEKSERIVKAPDFKLYETIFGERNMKKLAIFDSKNRNMGYIYNYVKEKKKYVCPRCTKNGKCVTATLKQQENGQNYVELNEIEHVCELRIL